MSTLLVQIKRIDSIERHPNADTLSILQIGGWNVIAKTEGILGQERVLYIPIDAIADKDHPFLNFLEGKRVKTIRLRGIISQGLCIPLSEVLNYIIKVKETDELTASIVLNTAFEEQSNLAEFLDIKKYEPPIPSVKFGGQQRTQPSGFEKYTDIEHFENFVSVLSGTDCVTVTEKIHGTSARFGIIDGEIIIGSRNLAFSYPQPENSSSNVYIDVFTRENILDKINQLKLMLPDNKDIVFYGEIAGPGVQGSVFKYGVTVPTLFLYDIKIDGKFLNWAEYKSYASILDMKICPILAESIKVEEIKTLVQIDGKSTVDESHVREGIVVKPVIEQFDRKLGRVVLKLISKEYLLKDGKDYKNE